MLDERMWFPVISDHTDSASFSLPIGRKLFQEAVS